MLARKALERFEAWKRNKTHQALLVTGARQVGKTYLVERFLEDNYPRHVKFDLVDQRRVLVEVKSGGSYLTHAALDNALGTKGYRIDDAIVLAETNVRVEGPISYLPLYMAGVI